MEVGPHGRIQRVSLALAFLISTGCGSALAPTRPSEPTETVAVAAASIVDVIDGDSASLVIDGFEVEVRIQGMNALEQSDCGGEQAEEAFALLLASGPLNVLTGETDRFGRLLVDIRAGDINVAEQMVTLGWALGSHQDGRYVPAMQTAAATGAGFWALDCDPTFDGALALGEILFDPPGNDRSNLAEEFVEIRNPTDGELSYEGWVVRDETTGHHFTLPPGVIAPGGSYRVRTGAGESDAENLYLDEQFPVWSNSGETVLLLDPSGTRVDHRFVEPS